ncbi:MAG: Lipopolysaccharide assembly protein domain [Clostridia bacterium]|jgi:uncharacterized integral membrane protein|nr:Lipopolysaccharide assembly protein domain [Clostridia bacterium]
MQLYFVLSLTASILVVIFAVTNAAAVPVRIFFVEYKLSLALIIFASTALGAIIATMLSFIKQFKLGKKIKKLNNENQALKAENQALEEENKKLQESAAPADAMQTPAPSPEEI